MPSASSSNFITMNQEETKEQNLHEEELVQNNAEHAENTAVQDEQELVESGENSDDDALKIAQEKYIRLYSDFDNFRKRTQKEKADLINYAAGDVLKDFLGVFDDFQRALEANKNTEDVAALKEGFELLYHKFDTIMKAKGLQEIECLGEIFNPDYHEAITNIPAGDDMKGKVVDVVQKGYVLKERVIRYAKVVVGQ